MEFLQGLNIFWLSRRFMTEITSCISSPFVHVQTSCRYLLISYPTPTSLEINAHPLQGALKPTSRPLSIAIDWVPFNPWIP